MTEKEYRSHHAISRSELWRIKESPEKFKYFKENPPESTPSLIFGQVVHKLVLENEDFLNEFAVLPQGIDHRTKAGKAEYTDFIKESNGKTVINDDIFIHAYEIAQSVNANDFCKKLLAGEHEKPFFWTDELTGEQCKCRVDCITNIGGINYIVDLKTCESATTSEFMKKSIDYGYHVQVSMYMDGVKNNGYENCEFVFIAVEKNPPYAINILQASELLKKYGQDEYRYLLGLYHYCKENNNWFGYLGKDNEINSIGLPVWIAKEYKN